MLLLCVSWFSTFNQYTLYVCIMYNYIISYALYIIIVNSTFIYYSLLPFYSTGFVNQRGMGTLSNSCILNTNWANCFQTRPIIQHDPAVHPMQDLAFTHWLSINVPTWAAIFISCSCEGDQPQWPSNRHHLQRGPAGRMTLPQLVNNLTDHLTDHPIYIFPYFYEYYTTMCMCSHVYVLYHRQCACVPDL